ncbi:hypothetical protein [Streptomyces sp. NPDC005732]|uniref:hypothetical protein n=1 Tax=Streptomyces sp. NPDC005732 TaxID=3157057 RepID=UPI0033EAE815
MEGVNWSLGDKSDRIKLRDFACCPGCRTEIVRHPQDTRQCITEWAHEVQTYFRQRAIAHTNSRSRSHDQRLLLLHDAGELVGAAVHSSTRHPRPQDQPACFDRRLEFYAVSLSRQGRTLSNGERASQALLRAVVSDITTRHDPRDEVFLTAYVAPENLSSQQCLTCNGWRQRKSNEPDLLLYAASLKTLQEVHHVPSAVVPADDTEETL